MRLYLSDLVVVQVERLQRNGGASRKRVGRNHFQLVAAQVEMLEPGQGRQTARLYPIDSVVRHREPFDAPQAHERGNRLQAILVQLQLAQALQVHQVPVHGVGQSIAGQVAAEASKNIALVRVAEEVRREI